MIPSEEFSKLSISSIETPKTLDDLPYELKEMILKKCDVISHQRLRACNKLFHQMPASKSLSFSDYQSWLKKIKAKKWDVSGECEQYEKVFWFGERMKFRNNGPKSIAFQSRVHLDLLSLTQDQYLYVCRNGLRFVKSAES